MGTVLAVERNDARSRYEGRRDGELVSLVDYVLRGDTMIVIHTGTEHRWRGNGFAADFIAQHPDYADLLAANAARR